MGHAAAIAIPRHRDPSGLSRLLHVDPRCVVRGGRSCPAGPTAPATQGVGVCGSGHQLHRCRGVAHMGRRGAEKLVAPAIFLGLTAASWACGRRSVVTPPRRRWFHSQSHDRLLDRNGGRRGRIGRRRCGICLRIDYVRDVVEHLGYPTYLLTIMGVWKLPGAVVLLVSPLSAAEGMGVRRRGHQLCLRHRLPRDRRGRLRRDRRTGGAARTCRRIVGAAPGGMVLGGVQVGEGDADPGFDLADHDRRQSGNGGAVER